MERRRRLSRPLLWCLFAWGLVHMAGGMGFGAFNEMVEFIATLTLPETNVGGHENTGWDLLSNLIGSVLAGLLICLRGRRTGQTEACEGA